MHRLKRGLYRLLGVRRPADLKELGSRVREGAARGLSRPSSLPGSLTLAGVVNGPQTGVQGCNGDPFDFRPCAGVCDGGCDYPLEARADRCPEQVCQAGGECWRCEYEEAQHDCAERTGGASC